MVKISRMNPLYSVDNEQGVRDENGCSKTMEGIMFKEISIYSNI